MKDLDDGVDEAGDGGVRIQTPTIPETVVDGSVSVDTLLGLLKIMNTTDFNFARRIGPDPHANGQETAACNGCPDFWELENGDIAIIGIRITEAAKAKLPATAGCGPDEEIVSVPRNLLLAARCDIAKLS
jgi:hypothetical protein